MLADAAEQICQLLRHLGQQGRHELSVIVAADAVALGVLAQAALQIVAAPRDRLFVEVDAAGVRRDGRRVAGVRRLQWAEVPLLLWHRDELPVGHYMDAVAARRMERQRLESPEPLRIDLRRGLVSVGGTVLRLPAMQFS